MLYYERLYLGRFDRAALFSGVHEHADALATFEYFLHVILRQLTLTSFLSLGLRGEPSLVCIVVLVSSRGSQTLFRLVYNKTGSDYSLFRSSRLGSLRARGKLELDLSFGIQDEARTKMFAASASESGYYVISTSYCK